MSFHKGDSVSLTKQVSNDWWKGSVRGQEGLIPDKYIMLRMKGEDDRERLESSRSNEDHKADQDDKRSRASSTSDKFPAASPSPIHGRRRGSATASPSSQRASRSSMTSSSRSSTSTKPATPPHVATVITVESNAPGFGPAGGGKSAPKDLEAGEAVGAPANTHIIKVSGPVTNLDETVTSATEAMAAGPRSRLPVSPDMEARLSTSQDSLASSTGSNRELKTQLDSTLAEVEAIAEHLEKQKKTPLEKSLSDIKHHPVAQVDPAPQPMLRRNTAEQISISTSRTLPSSTSASVISGGARPRKFSSPPDPAPRSSVTDTSNNAPPIMLRQSSWASREHVNASGQGETKVGFSKNKTLWEQRTNQTTPMVVSASDNIGSLRGGFRSNRDFWTQRTSIQQKQKQTPDLVLDLPATPSHALLSKPKPRPRAKVSVDSLSSSTSSGGSSDGDSETLAADQFAKPDRNTLRKTSAAATGNRTLDSTVTSSAPPAAAAVSTNNTRKSSDETSKRIPPVKARLQKKSPPEK